MLSKTTARVILAMTIVIAGFIAMFYVASSMREHFDQPGNTDTQTAATENSGTDADANETITIIKILYHDPARKTCVVRATKNFGQHNSDNWSLYLLGSAYDELTKRMKRDLLNMCPITEWTLADVPSWVEVDLGPLEGKEEALQFYRAIEIYSGPDVMKSGITKFEQCLIKVATKSTI